MAPKCSSPKPGQIVLTQIPISWPLAQMAPKCPSPKSGQIVLTQIASKFASPKGDRNAPRPNGIKMTIAQRWPKCLSSRFHQNTRHSNCMTDSNCECVQIVVLNRMCTQPDLIWGNLYTSTFFDHPNVHLNPFQNAMDDLRWWTPRKIINPGGCHQIQTSWWSSWLCDDLCESFDTERTQAQRAVATSKFWVGWVTTDIFKLMIWVASGFCQIFDD